MDQLHIIRKFSLDLQLPAGYEAYPLQRQCSEKIKTQLVPALDTLLDKYFDQPGVIKIQRLEIDLGVLSEPDFERLFIDKCLHQISDQLKHFSGQKSRLDNPMVKVWDESRYLLEQFFYFLQTGRSLLPASRLSVREWQGELLEAIKTEKEHFKEVFYKSVIHDPLIVERLVFQFDDNFMQELISVCEPLVKNEISQLIDHIRRFTTPDRSYPVRNKVFTALVHSLARQPGSQLAGQVNNLNEWFSKLSKDNENTPSQPAAEEQLDYLLLEFNPSLLPQPAHMPAPGEAEEISASQKASASRPDIKAGSMEMERHSITEEEDKAVFITNAGLVILHPFLVNLFEATGLTRNNSFPDDISRYRAVHLLQFMVSGEEALPEYLLPLNKLLCGLGEEEHIDRFIELNPEEKEEAVQLLEAVVGHWTILKHTSVDGLRQAFLQRRGKLGYNKVDKFWKLQVETGSIDILLDKLPWGISYIQLPWMKNRLITEWRM